MKKIIKYYSLLAGLLLSLIACEFSPSGIPLSEIEKPSEIAPDISIELNPSMDTLRLSEPAWITYSVNTGVNKLYRIAFQFDNTDIANLNYISTEKVSAYINSNSVEDGMHELKISTFTSTNSGSIADKTSSEAYLYELTWPVYINKSAKKNFTFNDLKFSPEGIKVSWSEYRYADFDRYEFGWSSPYYQSGKLVIKDPRQNSYIDSTYVEGCYKYYSVYVYYAIGGFKYDNLTYYKKIINPLIGINKDCSVDISWTHSKNEQNVKLYCIKTSAPNYGFPEEHDLANLNDTTLRLNEKIGFGGDYNVQLRYIPKGFDTYHTMLDPVGGLTKYALGDSIPLFQKAFHITAENFLLIYKNGTFSRYNFLTGERSDSLSITPVESSSLLTVTGSPDGNYFGYFENQEYVIRRSTDLTLVNKLNIEAYNGYNFILNDISISNYGLIGTADYNNNLRIFDILTRNKIFEKHFESNYFLRKALISPDGKYLAVMLKDYSLGTTSLVYYSFENNLLNELGRVNGVGEDSGSVLAYAPQSEQKIIVSRWRSSYKYNVEVRDSRTFELLYSVELPQFFVPVVYDFTTDRVIAQYQFFPTLRYSYLIDIKTGIQEKIVQFSGRESLVFDGGIAYSGNGRSIKIDDFKIK